MNFNSLPDHAVVATARSWLGTPYLHQASLKGVGCDCLGLILGIWSDLTGKIASVPNDYSSAWSEIDRSERLLNGLRKQLIEIDEQENEAGTVAALRLRRNRAVKHLIILTGNDTFIHAYEGNSVVENSLSDFWRSRIVARFKLPGCGDIA